MNQPRPFMQLDVFTAVAYKGNPLAVVLDGTGLSDATMQQFANWTHLSETTFLLPPTDPEADYRVRIFTPAAELPFAGHPTLGSCYAWLQAGGQPHHPDRIVQQCAKGLVPLRRSGQRLAFAAPTLQRSAPSPILLAQIASALGLQAQQILAAQLLDNGPVWLGLLLDAPQTVLELTPDHLALKALGVKVGVAAVVKNAAAEQLQVRAFAAPVDVAEDPVTGSLNASLAQWLIADQHLPPQYLAAQGICLGRDGRVWIEQDAQGQGWVGGDTVTCIEGQVQIP